MRNFNFIALILLTIIQTNIAILTKTQQKCLISIAQNLHIKQIVIVSEKNKFNVHLLKNIVEYKIFAQFSTLIQLNQSISYTGPKIYKRKTLYLLESFNVNLPIIFHGDNESFLSENVWIIFNEDQNFGNLYIPYNCQFIVIESENDHFNIFEIYNTRIYTRDLFTSNFAKWKENQLQIFQPDFYERRLNMNGTLLVIVADYFLNPCQHQMLCAYEEILEEIIRMMNFRPKLMHPDYLQQLWDNKTDIMYEVWIAFSVFDAYGYWKYVIGPIWKSPAFMHIKFIKLYEQGERSPHLRPFTRSAWLAIVFWLLISGVCVTYIDLKLNKKNCLIIDSFFSSFESFTNQCGCAIPNASSSRIAAIMTRTGPAFLIPLYSAVIISFVTVKVTKLPFTDLQGLIKDGSFKVGYENTTLIGTIFNESNSREAKAIREKFLIGLDDLPNTEDEAVEKICKNPKLAFVYFNNDLYYDKHPCKIIQIPKSIYQTWDALRLRGESDFYTIFNRILKSFRSAGILKRMEKIVYGEKPTDEKTYSIDPVEFESVADLLMLICSLYLFVPIILIIEILVFKISAIKN